MAELANGFISWLWHNSLQSSLAIVLVVAAQALLNKQLSARWRHLLWLVVVIRMVLPWSIETPLSIFNWVKSTPVVRFADPDKRSPGQDDLVPVESETAPASRLAKVARTQPGLWAALEWTWLSGAFLFGVHLCWTSWRLNRVVAGQRPVTDGAILDLLEDCKVQMGVRTPLCLVETKSVSSPALLGFIRPRLLLPAGLLSQFSKSELRYVFLHELGHLRRSDIPMNWVLSFLLVLHWFNPLVWYAFSRLKADRELACDALALSRSQDSDRQPYGQTIIKLLEHFSRPTLAPGLMGILETETQMKRRIRMIAKFRRANNWSVLAASVIASLAVVTLTDAQSSKPSSPASKDNQAKTEGPLRIVATSPKIGETEVSPALSEITVTFDRDMAKGFSWTGSGPDYPPIQEGKKPLWRDARTCVLPVKLQAAHYYRVGINSTSFQNFRSVDGEPARPSAIYFATQGASEEIKRKVSKPMIVELEPKNGTKDVDPSVKELRVSFNVPMGEGFSWTGGGPQFPTIPEGKKPYWSEDHKTCYLPVELKAGSEYRLGLNSPSHKNFQSAGGVPLEPITYSFSTR